MKDFNLIGLFKVMKKRKGLIFSITFLTILTSAAISYYALTPMYENSTQILVSQAELSNGPITNQTIQADLQLVNTYSVIIKSKRILEEVITELSLTSTVSEVSENMSVIPASNSQVIEITVRNKDPELAAEIANKTAQVFEKDIYELMNVKNVSILSTASLSANPQPVSPNHGLNLAIAFVIGLALGIGISYLIDAIDTTVKSESDVEELLDVPLIAIISPMPNVKKNKSKARVVLNQKEAYK